MQGLQNLACHHQLGDHNPTQTLKPFSSIDCGKMWTYQIWLHKGGLLGVSSSTAACRCAGSWRASKGPSKDLQPCTDNVDG